MSFLQGSKGRSGESTLKINAIANIRDCWLPTVEQKILNIFFFFKVESAGLADGLKLKRKNNIKDNSKVFVLNNEKNSISIYEDEGELNGSRIIGKYQELCFG